MIGNVAGTRFGSTAQHLFEALNTDGEVKPGKEFRWRGPIASGDHPRKVRHTAACVRAAPKKAHRPNHLRRLRGFTLPDAKPT